MASTVCPHKYCGQSCDVEKTTHRTHVQPRLQLVHVGWPGGPLDHPCTDNAALGHAHTNRLHAIDDAGAHRAALQGTTLRESDPAAAQGATFGNTAATTVLDTAFQHFLGNWSGCSLRHSWSGW
eukprot:m.168050 g.168050  ORF g.168050 m.168050 type:complete len:124 (+) comp9905_c0_seq2:54-425(+)